MPTKVDDKDKKYNIGKLRSGFGGKAGGAHLNVAELAVASAYDEELIDDEITVDESQFSVDLDRPVDTQPSLEGLSPAQREAEEERRKNNKATIKQKSGFFGANGKFANFRKGSMSFSINGTTFSGTKGTQIESKAISVTKGLAIDLTPVTLMADKRSESAYISELETAEPLVAYYDKETSVLRDIPVKMKKGRRDSLLTQDGLRLKSELPVDILLDEKSGYRLSADGVRFEAGRARFEGGIIHRNTEAGSESNAGVVDIADGEVKFDEVKWTEKFDIKNEKAVKDDAESISQYETELGLKHLEDDSKEDETHLNIVLPDTEKTGDDTSLEVDLGDMDKSDGDETELNIELPKIDETAMEDSEEYKAAMQLLELNETLIGISMYKLAMHRDSLSLADAELDKERVYTRIRNWNHKKKRITKPLKTLKAYVDKKTELLKNIEISKEVFIAAKKEGLDKYKARLAQLAQAKPEEEPGNVPDREVVPQPQPQPKPAPKPGPGPNPETPEQIAERKARRAALKNSYKPTSRKKDLRAEDTILDASKLQRVVRVIDPDAATPLTDWSTTYLAYGKEDRGWATANAYDEAGDARGRVNSRFFNLDNPTAISSFWYGIALVRMLLGLDNTEELNALAETDQGAFADDLNTVQLNIMEATARLHFAKECLKAVATGNFAGVTPTKEEAKNMGMQTSTFTELDEWKDVKFSLSIFPPLSFYLKFSPNFHFDFVHDFFIEASPDTPSPEDIVEMTKKEMSSVIDTTGEFDPVKIGTNVVEMVMGMVELQAGLYLALTGSMSLGISTGIAASIGTIVPTVSLLSADASLFANLMLRGTGKDQSIFDVTPLARFKLADFDPESVGGGIDLTKAALMINAGLSMDGVVGTSGTLKSSIFNNWTKQLWKKNFASWNLARLTFNTRLENHDKNEVFSANDAKSAFSLSILHHEIINTNPKDYGFKFANEATQVNALLSEGNKATEDNLASLDNIGEVLSKDPSSQSLEELEKALDTVNAIDFNITSLLDKTNYAEGHVGGNELLQKQIKTSKTDLAVQMGFMEALSSLTDEEKEKTSADDVIKKLGIDPEAFETYITMATQEDAIEEIATLEAITAYENKHMKEEASDAEANLKLITDFKYEDKDTQKKDPAKFEADRKRALVKHYLKNAKGWDTITSRLTDYADPEELRKYERGKIESETKKHTDNIKAIEELAASKKIDLNDANEEIFTFYKDKIGGEDFLKGSFTEFLDIDSVLSFEKNKMLKSGNNEQLFDLKERITAALDIIKDDPSKEKEQFDSLRKTLKGLISKEDAAKLVGLTVSPQEILDFENARIKDIMDKELPEYDTLSPEDQFKLLSKKIHRNYGFESQQRVNKNLKGKGKFKKGVAYTGGAVAAGVRYAVDAAKNLKDRITRERMKMVLKENVRIEDLIEYERQQAELDSISSLDEGYVENLPKAYRKRAEAAGKKPGEAGPDEDDLEFHFTFNINSRKSANYARAVLRRKRVATLTKYLGKINAIKDKDEKEKLTAKVRIMYFGGSIDKLSVTTSDKAMQGLQGTANEGILEDFADGFFKLGIDNGGYEYMNGKMYEDIEKRAAGRFKERVELVEQLLKKGESQSHIFEAYASLGGHMWWLGADAISQNKLKLLMAGDEGGNVIDKLSPEELYNLVNNVIRKNSTISFFPRIGKDIKNGIKSGIPEPVLKYVGANKAIDEDTQQHLKLAGYAERFDRLNEFKKRMEDPNDKEFSKLGEEEKRAKLFEFYTVELGAGNGLFKAMDAGTSTTDKIAAGVKMITPAMLIAYERRCIERESEKRRKRLEFLEGKQPGDDMSGYRKLATTDGKGFSGKLNYINAKMRNNYKTGADKTLKAEEVLSEAAIRDFEEKRRSKSNKKRLKRLDALKEAKPDVKGDVLKTYKAAGGGDGFAKENEGKITDKQYQLIKKAKSKEGRYEYLQRFQKMRVEQAQKSVDMASKPLDSLDRQRETFRKILAIAKDRRRRIEKAIAAIKQKAADSAEASSAKA